MEGHLNAQLPAVQSQEPAKAMAAGTRDQTPQRFKDAREIIQERGEEWDIPSVTGGRGVLDPGAF